MAMHGDGCRLCYEAEVEVEKLASIFKCAKNITCNQPGVAKFRPFRRPILLQHFPLYRRNDDECVPDDDFDHIVSNEDEQYRPLWETLSEESTLMLIRKLNPIAVFNGHTHKGCRKRWSHPTSFWEYTINSFSWRNGDRPTFLMANILDGNRERERETMELSFYNYIFKSQQTEEFFLQVIVIYAWCFLSLQLKLYSCYSNSFGDSAAYTHIRNESDHGFDRRFSDFPHTDSLREIRRTSSKLDKVIRFKRINEHLVLNDCFSMICKEVLKLDKGHVYFLIAKPFRTPVQSQPDDCRLIDSLGQEHQFKEEPRSPSPSSSGICADITDFSNSGEDTKHLVTSRHPQQPYMNRLGKEHPPSTSVLQSVFENIERPEMRQNIQNNSSKEWTIPTSIEEDMRMNETSGWNHIPTKITEQKKGIGISIEKTNHKAAGMMKGRKYILDQNKGVIINLQMPSDCRRLLQWIQMLVPSSTITFLISTDYQKREIYNCTAGIAQTRSIERPTDLMSSMVFPENKKRLSSSSTSTVTSGDSASLPSSILVTKPHSDKPRGRVTFADEVSVRTAVTQYLGPAIDTNSDRMSTGSSVVLSQMDQKSPGSNHTLSRIQESRIVEEDDLESVVSDRESLFQDYAYLDEVISDKSSTYGNKSIRTVLSDEV
uniref:Metallophos domain-containing protein n=1 Tax=Heterorhabditis bacteriophora TaxID=37862 RepID=A0A1I7X2U0_HETBA